MMVNDIDHALEKMKNAVAEAKKKPSEQKKAK